MTDLSALIERLEAAPEGSRELDVRIEITRRSLLKGLGAAAIAYEISRVKSIIGFDNFAEAEGVPHYTTSLDAALSLVPENSAWIIERDFGQRTVAIIRTARGIFTGASTGPETVMSPARALCAAALRCEKVVEAANFQKEESPCRLSTRPSLARSTSRGPGTRSSPRRPGRR